MPGVNSLIASKSNNTERYKSNFLQQAVCEFRFPILLELGEKKPPADFVRALRKDYPHHESVSEFSLDLGSHSADSTYSHVFRSSKSNWSVALKQSSFLIETSKYTGFEVFREKVMQAVRASSAVIDSNFFTRIGLRYINVIDEGEDPIDGWVNPALIAPLAAGTFINISEYSGRVLVAHDDGGCLLQHGIKMKARVDGKLPYPSYLIDIDSYRTDIEIDDVGRALDDMHTQAFDLFDWSLGEKARNKLEQPPR